MVVVLFVISYGLPYLPHCWCFGKSLQALIDYINSDFDIGVYWKTLNANGITKERLLSYDRAIHSEPNFRRDQKEGLLRDLGNYMRTLKVVFIYVILIMCYFLCYSFFFFFSYWMHASWKSSWLLFNVFFFLL